MPLGNTILHKHAATLTSFWNALQLQGRVIQALFLRETKTRFGDRRLGFIWAFLEAILHTLVFVAIRKVLGMSAPPGIPMPLYLLVGIVPFFMFRNTANQIMNCVRGNKALLVFPQVKIMDFVLSRAVLEFVTMVVVMWALVLGMMILGFEVRVQNPLLVLVPFIMFSLFGVGFGLVLLGLNAHFPVTQIIWQQSGRILYFTSGVIITADRIPVQYYDEMAWNPLFQMVEFLRSASFPTYDSSLYFNDWFYVLCWILGLWLVGLVLQRKWLWWILRSE